MLGVKSESFVIKGDDLIFVQIENGSVTLKFRSEYRQISLRMSLNSFKYLKTKMKKESLRSTQREFKRRMDVIKMRVKNETN